MPGKAWQPLAAVLVALGIPAAAAAEWRHLVARHPVAALGLAAGWLAVCGAVVLARQALAGPARRRLEQAGNAADRAAGWWLSGYGRRYRRWVLDSRRYVDVKDLATGGDHTPELDDVYVDVALVRRAPHQVSGDPLGSGAEDAAGRHSVSEFLDRRGRVVLVLAALLAAGRSSRAADAELAGEPPDAELAGEPGDAEWGGDPGGAEPGPRAQPSAHAGATIAGAPARTESELACP